MEGLDKEKVADDVVDYVWEKYGKNVRELPRKEREKMYLEHRDQLPEC